MATTQATSAMLPIGGTCVQDDQAANPSSDVAWRIAPPRYHAPELPSNAEKLTRTVVSQLQIELDVVYDMFNDRIDSQNWERVCRTVPYAYGYFKITSEPVLSNTLYTACFRFLPGVFIKFRLPRTAYLTVKELREIIIGFVGPLRLLLRASNICAKLLRCMHLNLVKQGGYACGRCECGDLLKATIWDVAKLGRAAETEETENGDCHVLDEHRPTTGGHDQKPVVPRHMDIAITQEWRPCPSKNPKCPTTIKQILLAGTTLVDEVRLTVTEGCEALK
ncbi:hypothetical protein FN846DRAFT_911594 [Sphaerosporella brunnea]|uniref:Uncharacterized protein n=1 Tax=Sphaerosporella brunnea TaxID=1250544 RepID=A0A5J5EIU0_9PEZI|nr:hypothetical protein FN846DRAFT_911594 [Sphaerosporella brunnea]